WGRESLAVARGFGASMIGFSIVGPRGRAPNRTARRRSVLHGCRASRGVCCKGGARLACLQAYAIAVCARSADFAVATRLVLAAGRSKGANPCLKTPTAPHSAGPSPANRGLGRLFRRGLLRSRRAALVDQIRFGLVVDHRLVDHDLADGLGGRQIKHGIEQNLFQNRAQATGTGL